MLAWVFMGCTLLSYPTIGLQACEQRLRQSGVNFTLSGAWRTAGPSRWTPPFPYRAQYRDRTTSAHLYPSMPKNPKPTPPAPGAGPGPKTCRRASGGRAWPYKKEGSGTHVETRGGTHVKIPAPFVWW